MGKLTQASMIPLLTGIGFFGAAQMNFPNWLRMSIACGIGNAIYHTFLHSEQENLSLKYRLGAVMGFLSLAYYLNHYKNLPADISMLMSGIFFSCACFITEKLINVVFAMNENPQRPELMR